MRGVGLLVLWRGDYFIVVDGSIISFVGDGQLMCILVTYLYLVLYNYRGGLSGARRSGGATISSTRRTTTGNFRCRIYSTCIGVAKCDGDRPTMSIPRAVGNGPMGMVNRRTFCNRASVDRVCLPFNLRIVRGKTFCHYDTLGSIGVPRSMARVNGSIFFHYDTLRDVAISSRGNGCYSFSNILFGGSGARVVTCPRKGARAGCAVPSSMAGVDNGIFNCRSTLGRVIIPTDIARLPGRGVFICPSRVALTIVPNSTTRTCTGRRGVGCSVQGA